MVQEVRAPTFNGFLTSFRLPIYPNYYVLEYFVLFSSAKTIKNCITVNEELTAEEWKRRYEKEKDRSTKLKGIIAKYELELNKWRQGIAVPEDEQLSAKDDPLPSSESTTNLTIPNPNLPAFSNEEQMKLETERQDLYQQLDERVCFLF